MVKIVSRNVNGIRAVRNKGFIDTIHSLDADVICLQEPKALLHQLSPAMLDLGSAYHLAWHHGTRPGYAGTCIYTRHKPDYVINQFADPLLHDDGRTIELGYEGLTIINCYFPNGGTRADGTEMLSYKIKFYETMMRYMQHKGDSVVLVGDLNIAHTEKDIARPKENINTIGFTARERAVLDIFLSQGWIDVFRHLHPDQIEYTRRSVRSGARARNIGWRLDCAYISQHLLKSVRSFDHHTQIMGSDHCPISLNLTS